MGVRRYNLPESGLQPKQLKKNYCSPNAHETTLNDALKARNKSYKCDMPYSSCFTYTHHSRLFLLFFPKRISPRLYNNFLLAAYMNHHLYALYFSLKMAEIALKFELHGNYRHC